MTRGIGSQKRCCHGNILVKVLIELFQTQCLHWVRNWPDMIKQSNFNQKFLNLLPCYNHMHPFIHFDIYRYLFDILYVKESNRMKNLVAMCISLILCGTRLSNFKVWHSENLFFLSKHNLINVIAQRVETVFENSWNPGTKDLGFLWDFMVYNNSQKILNPKVWSAGQLPTR